jgi:hypothetical protein
MTPAKRINLINLRQRFALLLQRWEALEAFARGSAKSHNSSAVKSHFLGQADALEMCIRDLKHLKP